MSRRIANRPPRRKLEEPEQLRLVAAPRTRGGVEPEQAAKVAIPRRAKPSTLLDHVKLVLTLDLRRALAERLSAKAIRQRKNLDGVVIEILALPRVGGQKSRHDPGRPSGT